MSDPAAAQVTYTSNILTSPSVIGAVVTLIASVASASGVHILDDPAVQQQVVLVLGILLTAIAHYVWPHKDGRLSLSAPISTPTPQNIPTGASVVTVPAPRDQAQVATVQPIDVGAQVVEVAPATDETRRDRAEPMAVTVTPAPEGPKP